MNFAKGSIGWIEAYKTAPTEVVQTTPQPTIAMASADVDRNSLDRVASMFEPTGIETRIEASEQAVLWEKAARLAPMAALTSLTGRTVGQVRTDAALRPLLEASVPRCPSMFDISALSDGSSAARRTTSTYRTFAAMD